MKNAEDYVVIGKIGSTFGIQGWLKVYSYSDSIDGILEYRHWHIESQTGWQPIEVKNCQQHGKGIVVKFAGYHTPEDARVLTGKKIAIKRSQLPTLETNEYYWADLEGLMVIDQHDETLGQVDHMMETGANDVMVVKSKDGKFHAIPFLLNKVVTRIDLENQVMHVNWELI